MDNLVSIIIPCYNVEKYLDRCLDTVVHQTYPHLEIILVDDGAKDNTPALCDAWAEKDKRIRVIHKENDGLANARNSGIEVCNGEYVMFVDSDDYIEPDMVEFMLTLSIEYEADVSRCGYYFDYDNGSIEAIEESEAVQLLDYEERMIDLINGRNISGVAWNKLYKREVIKTHMYDKVDGCSEDIMHNFRVYQDIDKTVFCNVPKYHYVENNASITHGTFSYGAFDIIRARKIIVDYFNDNPAILPTAKEWYIKSSLMVMSECVMFNACLNSYYELKKEIKHYKKFVFKSGRFKNKYKVKYIALCYLPFSINRLLKGKVL